MVKKVSWSQKIRPKDMEYLNFVLEAYQSAKGLDSKGEALVHFVRSRAHIEEHKDNSDVLIPEVVFPDDREFETICPFGFLKKINPGGYGGNDKWHCLKNQGPNSKGKPILLANGEDKQSIKAICEVCQLKWQMGPQKIDQVRLMFEEIGDQKISSVMYFCIRPTFDDYAINFSTTENGSWYCPENHKKVTIKHTCMAKGCPFLIKKEIVLNMFETEPYRKALEVLE